MKKIFILLLSLMLLCACTTKNTEQTVEENNYNIASISKYGNIILEKKVDELKTQGIEIADIVTITINGINYEMPVGTLYSDVDPGKMILRFDTEDDEVGIAINNGNFAASTGLYTKEKIEEDPGYKWTCNAEEVKIEIAVKAKQGYAKEYEIKQLVRTYERADYPELNDEEYANFRVVFDGILYRSSSPIDPDLARSTYVDEALKLHQITYIINLDDKQSAMEKYDGFADTYYSTCQIFNVDADYEFAGDVFKEAVKTTVKTIIENDGPFLIHCKEGKDRTGVMCAIIEAFNGWSLQQIIDDYMKTYTNFYHVEVGSEKYDLIIDAILNKNLCTILNVDSLEGVNLQEGIVDYLISTGLTQEDLTALQSKLQ